MHAHACAHVCASALASRFDQKVLKFARENGIYLFLTPPDTTGVTQLLDQINQTLHSHYRTEKENLFLWIHSKSVLPT